MRPAMWLDISEAVLLGAAVSLTVFALQWRYGFNLGDEGWLWYISQRTALGEIPFRDFFSYDPGRYYWSAAIFKLLERSGWYQQLLANYLFAIIGLALTGMLFLSPVFYPLERLSAKARASSAPSAASESGPDPTSRTISGAWTRARPGASSSAALAAPRARANFSALRGRARGRGPCRARGR